MKAFVSFWNRVYFSLYCILYFFTHYFLGMILKYLFYRPMSTLPIFKRRLTKHRLTTQTWIEQVDYFYENPRSGFLMFFTNAAITYVIYLLFFLFINIIYVVYGTSIRVLIFEHLELFVSIILGFSVSFCHIVIWKNNRYLSFFSFYKKESRIKRVIWSIGTFLFLIILTTIVFLTFRYAEIRNGFWE